MLTLQQVLNMQSDALVNARVKIIRHRDQGMDYFRDVIKDRDTALEYQREQARDIFNGCDYIVSFFALERNRAVFFGVFKVNGYEKHNGAYYYNLEEIKEFGDLIDRVIIDWGDNARSWHQWYHKNPKEIKEILPHGYIGNFPGLLNIVLDFNALEILVKNPEANYEWKNHLSLVNGIYMILDTSTGNQYIGSAYGNGGIWQRWSSYISNHTGGNVEFIKLMNDDPFYYKNFRFSILQTLPSNIEQRDIVKIEHLYKEKLGSKAHGLNKN